MLIKKIVNLCTKTGIVRKLSDESGIPWFGNGEAFYQLPEFSLLDEETFCTVFDINEKKQDKIHFSFNESIPEGFDFSDTIPNESQYQPIENIVITYGGKQLIPLRRTAEILFINKEHLSPLKDLEKDVMYFFSRRSGDGKTYIAVKIGFEVRAIIAPCDYINKDFSDILAGISELTKRYVESLGDS